MNDTWLTLRKPIPDAVVEILRSVERVATRLGIEWFIVGATARDILFEHVYETGISRATNDVDFGMAVENWTQYENLKNALIENENFRADRGMEQRLWIGTGRSDEMKIDLVPYGGVESPAGEVTFPSTDFEMNTSGFAEAFEDALQVRISRDLQVRVVSLAGLAVLKFIAYHDRRQERQKDLQDIWFLTKNYLGAGNEERLYQMTELIEDENFDLRTVGARLLGRDMAKLLTTRTKEIILGFLSETEENNELEKIAYIIGFWERKSDEGVEEVIKTLQMLKRGILEGLTA